MRMRYCLDFLVIYHMKRNILHMIKRQVLFPENTFDQSSSLGK